MTYSHSRDIRHVRATYAQVSSSRMSYSFSYRAVSFIRSSQTTQKNQDTTQLQRTFGQQERDIQKHIGCPFDAFIHNVGNKTNIKTKEIHVSCLLLLLAAPIDGTKSILNQNIFLQLLYSIFIQAFGLRLIRKLLVSMKGWRGMDRIRWKSKSSTCTWEMKMYLGCARRIPMKCDKYYLAPCKMNSISILQE